MQNLSVRKNIELQEERMKDFLRRDEAWGKPKEEAEELRKKTVSLRF